MTVTKKQLANLKPIQKGEVRNPNGSRARVDPKLRSLSVESFNKIIQTVMTGTLKDLKALAENQESTVAEVAVATSIMIATKKGDYSVVKQIVEQIIGKIPDQLHISAGLEIQAAPVDMDQLREAIAELRKSV
jgi:hypothetical protein